MTTIFPKLFQALNNRELSLLIWIIFVVIYCLCYPKLRNCLFQVIKSFFAWKLTLAYILMFTYIICTVWILKTLSIWKVSHISLTVLWCLCTAFVMFFGFEKTKDPNFFKDSVKNNINGLVFVEFFVNLYVFSFWIEFMIVPILAIIGIMKAITESNKEYKPVDRLIDYILGIAGSFLLIYAFYKMVTDFNNFATINNLESFYMPILLSILFVPFVYMAALTVAYEMFFVRLGFFVPDRKVLIYAKIKTIFSIRFNILKLRTWQDYVYKNWRFKNKKEVKVAFTIFNNSNTKNQNKMV